MAAGHCVRCGAEVYGLVRSDDDVHVCKDIAARLARRERQVQAILPFLSVSRVRFYPREVAEDIVKTLAGLGVAED